MHRAYEIRRFSVAVLPFLIATVVATAANADWSAQVIASSAEVDGAEPNQSFGVTPVQVRVSETVVLSLVLEDPDGQVYSDVGQVRLGRRVQTPDHPLPEGVEIRWFRVVPRAAHQALDPPNPGNPTFSNNVLFGPEHGDWLGYDTLEYETLPLTDGPGVSIDGASVEVTSTRGSRSDRGAGSSWYAVEVRFPDGQSVRSPDGSEVDRYGLSRQVLRVSFRESDNFLGWLSTYFNVPNLFGSAGPTPERHQAELYLGADCADVLVGAYRASGADVDYTSVSGIRRLAEPVGDPFMFDPSGLTTDLSGAPVALAWGVDVLPGDLMAINYESDPDNQLPRRWDHIGAVVGDSTASDGVLNGDDYLRHMSSRGLRDQPILSQGQIRVQLWRWRH